MIIITCACILLVMTLLLSNKLIEELSQGSSLQKGEFIRTSYNWKMYANYCGVFFAGAALLVWLFHTHLVKTLNTTKRAKQAIRISKVLFWAEINISILYLFLAILSFLSMQYISFAFQCSIFFLSLRLLLDALKWRSYFLKYQLNQVVSDFHLFEYERHVRDNRLDEAGQAIAKACEVDPSNVSAWALRAIYAESYLNNKREADIYIEKASENLKNSSHTSNKERADYEGLLGLLLYGRGSRKLAIQHMEYSIELHYNQERADYLEQLKQQDHDS